MQTTNPDGTNADALLQSSVKSDSSPVVAERTVNKQNFQRQGSQVEFLPERIRYQRLRRHRLIRQGYLLAICIVVMVILTCVRQGRIAQARANLVTLEKSRKSLRQQVSMIPSLEKQVTDLLIKKQIDEEIGGRTDCTVILAELCRITPSNIVIISLDLQTVDLSAKAGSYSRATGAHRGARPTVVRKGRSKDAVAPVRRARLTVTGLAMSDVDVANFIGQLSAGRLFENVNMGYTKTVTFRQHSAREFQASCYLTR
ncbi:MAG: PilN domain-containing protein [Phycisphaerae bacterium]|nr:PilN domain-containing protein [Phycisphaerae bacterium]